MKIASSILLQTMPKKKLVIMKKGLMKCNDFDIMLLQGKFDGDV